MSEKDDPGYEHFSEFRELMADVRPLDTDRVPPHLSRPPPRPTRTLGEVQEVLRDSLSDHHDPAEVETGEELFFARPGVPRAVLRRLRRGQFSVEAELDLHGMTVSEARSALAGFLAEARRRRATCLRVVHGKGRGSRGGQPILKVKVNHWLRQRDEVLAFCSARPVDGGTGAVYVLIKRR